MAGPCSPRDVAVLGIAKTLLSVNQQLMRELSGARRVRLEIEDGTPILIPDPNGWAVTAHTSGHQYTGLIKAPAILEAAKALPVGSKWQMRWEKGRKRWIGTPWEHDEKKRPDYIRLPRAMFEQMQNEIADLRRRVEQAG